MELGFCIGEEQYSLVRMHLHYLNNYKNLIYLHVPLIIPFQLTQLFTPDAALAFGYLLKRIQNGWHHPFQSTEIHMCSSV